MIRHCVMCRIAEADIAAWHAVMQGLRDLVETSDGLSGFIAGPNRDFEALSPGFTYGFTFDADTQDALNAYAEDPVHKALGARLLALTGGVEGLRVYDLEVAS